MLYFAHKLLKEEIYKDIRRRLLLCSDWGDGTNSTSGKDTKVKRNLEIGIGKCRLGKLSHRENSLRTPKPILPCSV